MSSPRFAAIILAAGLSQRMQDFKPLLPLGVETTADRLIGTFLRNDIDVVLVAGHRRNELQAGLRTQDIRIVENPDYPLGMFTSVRRGLAALGSGYRAAFVAPVDIPLVRSFTIRKLLAASEAFPDRLLYPVFGRSRGHPPLLPARLFPAILDQPADSNLKAALQSEQKTAVEVKVPDSFILFDIDTPADYRLLQERFTTYEIPNPEECESILREVYPVAPSIYRHCVKVASVADSLGRALSGAGLNLDLAAIHSAALLHDLAKGQPEHETAGAGLLAEMGFGQIAGIIARHTDWPEGARISLETQIVYLADKLVEGEEIVPLEKRYQSALQRFGENAEARANILRRRDHALSVKQEIEHLLGCTVERVI
jgi:molybdenum cofactor cytidylyltransferase